MPPKPLIDLSKIDLTHVEAGIEKIRELNPQRYEMEQLHGIIMMDTDEGVIVGYKDVREDEFWVRGHIPGRPLMPGVLMCEAAAQLSGYYFYSVLGKDRFLGFGGLEDVKFRGEVVPGDRLILAGRKLDLRTRRATFACQGFVEDKLVYEGTIIGIAM